MLTSKIKSIRAVGPRKVWDIEVQTDHNYFANKVLSHNCSYHELLDFYGEKYGTELYRKKDLFIKYYHKSLKFYPTHPNGNILRGDTRIFAVIDELGLFPLPKGNEDEDEQSARANADEAHKSLTNSLTTVQAISISLLEEGVNAPPALMLGVSSPMSMRDKVMRLLGDSKTPEGEKYILGVNLPTWKVNPNIQRDTPVIALAYARNAEKAERDFGANPPRVHSRFVGNGVFTHELFTEPPTHTIEYRYDDPGMLYGHVKFVRAIPYPTLVTIDAGSVNNSFSLTASYFNPKTGKSVNCLMLEVMCHDGLRINFNKMYKHVILPVCKDLNAVALIADQWQSLDLLHRAKEDLGNGPDGKPNCLTTQYSPRRKDFDFFISLATNGNLVLPTLPRKSYDDVMDGSIVDYRLLNGKPVQHFLLQATTVRDLGHGKCPTKGEGYTDDIFRAAVLQTKMHDPKVMERLKAAINRGVASKGSALPVYLSRGGTVRK